MKIHSHKTGFHNASSAARNVKMSEWPLILTIDPKLSRLETWGLTSRLQSRFPILGFGLPTTFLAETYGSASTLEGARRGLPPGLYNLGRNDDDDPVILRELDMMTLRIFCPDENEPIPRRTVLELTCDGEHGLLATEPVQFEHPDGYIAQMAEAMKAGWKETRDRHGRKFLGPCCSGKRR